MQDLSCVPGDVNETAHATATVITSGPNVCYSKPPPCFGIASQEWVLQNPVNVAMKRPRVLTMSIVAVAM